MRTMLLFAALSITFIGCENEETESLKNEVSKLQTEIRRLSSLVEENSQMRREIDALTAKTTALEDRLLLIELLADYVSIDDSGDVVIEGANLVVRNGLGQTECSDINAPDCNGKGNIIIGYAETPAQCSGGAWQGDACLGSLPECTRCEQFAEPNRSGSHNLLLGRGQQYASYSGALLGEYSTVRAPRAVQLGTYGVINAREGAILAGKHNRVEQLAGVVVSGDRNTVGDNGATVFGGDNRRAGYTEDGTLVSYVPDIVGMEYEWRRQQESSSEE